ncbi:MAG: hypothetical protein L6R45_13765 [Anaerolineae bacterium]|nr:hypothetical protein [Anaerolineae bacterium]
MIERRLSLASIPCLAQGLAETAQGAKLVIGAVQSLPLAGGGPKRFDSLSWVVFGQGNNPLPFSVSGFRFRAADLRGSFQPAQTGTGSRQISSSRVGD